MVAKTKKYKQINNRQYTHNKHYVQLQNTTEMAKRIIRIIVFSP